MPVESEAFGYELVCVWRMHLWVVPADVVPSGVIGHEEEQVRQSGHVKLEHIRCVGLTPAWRRLSWQDVELYTKQGSYTRGTATGCNHKEWDSFIPPVNNQI